MIYVETSYSLCTIKMNLELKSRCMKREALLLMNIIMFNITVIFIVHKITEFTIGVW